MATVVKLIPDKSSPILDRNISFTSSSFQKKKSSGKMHNFMQEFLISFPSMIITREPNITLHEVGIQLYEGDKRTRMAGSIDIAYFGLEHMRIEWGVFVEVKSSYSLEQKLSKYRRRRRSRPPLPLKGTFEQIAKHMTYISQMPGYEFNGRDFIYLLVHPKKPPKNFYRLVSNTLGDWRNPDSRTLQKAERLKKEINSLIRVVEVTSSKIIFRDSIFRRCNSDLVLNINLLDHFSERLRASSKR